LAKKAEWARLAINRRKTLIDDLDRIKRHASDGGAAHALVAPLFSLQWKSLRLQNIANLRIRMTSSQPACG
jgi:hypothetical protein